jgi:hypothetical protein
VKKKLGVFKVEKELESRKAEIKRLDEQYKAVCGVHYFAEIQQAQQQHVYKGNGEYVTSAVDVQTDALLASAPESKKLNLLQQKKQDLIDQVMLSGYPEELQRILQDVPKVIASVVPNGIGKKAIEAA